MLYYPTKGKVTFLHVNSASTVKFTFLQESHSKIKNKMTHKHDIFWNLISKNFTLQANINFYRREEI